MKTLLILTFTLLGGLIGVADAEPLAWKKGTGWGWVWGEDDQVGEVGKEKTISIIIKKTT